MIANPKDIAVLMLDGGDVEEQTLLIVPLEPEFGLVGFVLKLGAARVCWSLSARALSRWALERGAKAVRFDFDLRFEQ